MWIIGWKFDNSLKKDIEKLDKCLLIAEPHTHICDIFFLFLITWYFRWDHLKFLVTEKHIYPFLATFLNLVLGEPIIVKNSIGKNGLVNQIVSEINKRDRIFLQICPSGTRKKTDKWKSWFYHIAYNSDIPILCFHIDIKTKTFSFTAPFKLTGNYKNDMDKIRLIYQNKDCLNINNVSKIFIAEEEIN